MPLHTEPAEPAEAAAAGQDAPSDRRERRLRHWRRHSVLTARDFIEDGRRLWLVTCPTRLATYHATCGFLPSWLRHWPCSKPPPLLSPFLCRRGPPRSSCRYAGSLRPASAFTAARRGRGIGKAGTGGGARVTMTIARRPTNPCRQLHRSADRQRQPDKRSWPRFNDRHCGLYYSLGSTTSKQVGKSEGRGSFARLFGNSRTVIALPRGTMCARALNEVFFCGCKDRYVQVLPSNLIASPFGRATTALSGRVLSPSGRLGEQLDGLGRWRDHRAGPQSDAAANHPPAFF